MGRHGPDSSSAARPSAPVARASGRSRRRRKRTKGERFLRWAVVFVAVVLAGAGELCTDTPATAGDRSRRRQCPSCVSVPSGQPFNVLIVGSDSRAGDSGAAAEAFGNVLQGGRCNAATPSRCCMWTPPPGEATLLSIPRDTYVTVTGLPASSGLARSQQDQLVVQRRPGSAHRHHRGHLRHPHRPLRRGRLHRAHQRRELRRRDQPRFHLPGARQQRRR